MRRLGLSLLAAFGLMSSSAFADSITFDLSTVESGETAVLPAHLVKVTVTTGFAGGTNCPLGISTTTCVQVAFAPDTANGSTLSTVLGPLEINVNGAFDASTPDGGGFAGGVSICGPGTAHTTCTGGGEGAATFGTMNLETAATSNNPSVIYLTAVSGNSWAGAINVLAPDSKGFEAVYADGSDGVQYGGKSSSVPEPTSVILFGSVAFLAGSALRRKLARP